MTFEWLKNWLKPKTAKTSEGTRQVSASQTEQILKALEELFILADSYGTRQLIFEIKQEQPIYVFKTKEGKNAKGTLSRELINGLLSLGTKEFTLKNKKVKIKRSAERIILDLEGEKRPRCLFLDDQPIYGALLQKHGKAAGIDIEVISSVTEAQRLLNGTEGTQYQALLCDVHMPQGSGIDLVRELRLKGSNLRIAMLSSDSSVESQSQALDAGADAYFVKSEDPQVILAFLRGPIGEGD